MIVELGLQFLGKRRALIFLGFLKPMPRTVLGGLFILRHASEGFTGFAEFYDVIHGASEGDIAKSLSPLSSFATT